MQATSVTFPFAGTAYYRDVVRDFCKMYGFEFRGGRSYSGAFHWCVDVPRGTPSGDVQDLLRAAAHSDETIARWVAWYESAIFNEDGSVSFPQ